MKVLGTDQYAGKKFIIFLFFNTAHLLIFTVVIGQVNKRLKDKVKNLARYIIDIRKVLKSTMVTLPKGKAVFSVPYESSPDCPCPRLPLKKTFLLGSSIVQNAREFPAKTGLTLEGRAFIREWTSDVPTLLKKRCTKDLDFRELN